MTPVSWLTGKEPTCKFCQDKGCIACPGEQYKAQLDKDGNPKPIFVAHLDNPAEMDALKAIFGRDAIEERMNLVNGDRDMFAAITNLLASEANERLAKENKGGGC